MAGILDWFPNTAFGATGSPEAMQDDREVSELLARLQSAQQAPGQTVSLPFAGMVADVPAAAEKKQVFAPSVEPSTLESGTPPGRQIPATKSGDRLVGEEPIGGVTTIQRNPSVRGNKVQPPAPTPDFGMSFGERMSTFGDALTGRAYSHPAAVAQDRAAAYGALVQMGFDPKTAELAARQPELLKALLASKLGAGKSTGIGLNPVWLEDDQGNTVLGQMSDRGEAIRSKLPPGLRPLSPMEQAGGKRYAGELGKSAAEAEAMLAPVKTQVTKALKDINRLRSHPGLDAATGLSSVLDPRNIIPGTDAWNFWALNKTAKAESFMAAREGLKGAGQVTDFEGEKGEQAIANLENAQSREQYLEALDSVEEMMRASYADLQKKAELGGYKGRGSGAREPTTQPRGGLQPGQAGIPADARLAPNGRYYRPDPDRPGKYIEYP